MREQTEPLTGAELLRLVEEVADELPEDDYRRSLIVVGGAALAWSDLRDATRDVDCLESLDETLTQAIEVIARRHDLAPRWMNDAASSFRPAGVELDRGTVVLDHPRLLVITAPLDQIFIMKILASRAADTDDIAALWPLTSFATPHEAAQAFRAAYPHEAEDPHLAAWLAGIVDE